MHSTTDRKKRSPAAGVNNSTINLTVRLPPSLDM